MIFNLFKKLLGDGGGDGVVCACCGERHDVHTLGWGYREPVYWLDLSERELKRSELSEELCVIRRRDKTDYFIKGLLQIPIIGSKDSMDWVVWSSLSKANHQKIVEHWDDPERDTLEPPVGVLSNSLRTYPETLLLKMRAHHQKPGLKPLFELEPTDHPLAVHQREGISRKDAEAMQQQLFHPPKKNA
jgi:hypothetical protein